MLMPMEKNNNEEVKKEQRQSLAAKVILCSLKRRLNLSEVTPSCPIAPVLFTLSRLPSFISFLLSLH